LAILEIHDVVKRFGGLVAIDHVTLKVEAKEIVGLIGPNGAGKTTLFNMITRVFPSDEGSIAFEGKECTKLKRHDITRLGIGRTWQITRPFKNMTALDNVVVGVITQSGVRTSFDELRKDASNWLDFLGLAQKKYALAKDMTFAELRKLEIARALATKPKLLLLDEPLSGLNSSEIDETLKVVHRIRDELSITIFWIEHIMRAIMSVCERVIVLNFGAKIAEGTPRVVSKDPEVVKAYLGGEEVCLK
jgi:branched-chain amino acid transport system ATP-binding protein